MSSADKPPDEVVVNLDSFDTVTKARGIIIDYAVEVEQALSNVLACYMTQDTTKKSQFIQFLSKETFSFGMKISLFGELDFHNAKSFGGLFKGLTGDLMYISQVRNSLAHEPRDPLAPYINIKNTRKPGKTLIDEQFVFEFMRQAKETREKLDALRGMLEVGGVTSGQSSIG